MNEMGSMLEKTPGSSLCHLVFVKSLRNPQSTPKLPEHLSQHCLLRILSDPRKKWTLGPLKKEDLRGFSLADALTGKRGLIVCIDMDEIMVGSACKRINRD